MDCPLSPLLQTEHNFLCAPPDGIALQKEKSKSAL
jgi:hypothetical protein